MRSLYCGDCLEVMKEIPDGSIDLVLTDPPYGTTACKWDTVINLELMWTQLKRVIKKKGAIVLTAGQPFTSALIMSNAKMFKYCWVWKKNTVTGFANAKKQPLRNVEDVVVFYFSTPLYNPQGLVKFDKKIKNSGSEGGGSLRSDTLKTEGRGQLRTAGYVYNQEFTNYPRQTLEGLKIDKEKLHPTQKPVALMEYLIRTYTNPFDTVLDFTMGSGTTGVAARNLARYFIGIELDKGYFETAKERIENA